MFDSVDNDTKIKSNITDLCIGRECKHRWMFNRSLNSMNMTRMDELIEHFRQNCRELDLIRNDCQLIDVHIDEQFSQSKLDDVMGHSNSWHLERQILVLSSNLPSDLGGEVFVVESGHSSELGSSQTFEEKECRLNVSSWDGRFLGCLLSSDDLSVVEMIYNETL